MAKHFSKQNRVGVDGTLISASFGDTLAKKVDLVCPKENLVDLLWTNRPGSFRFLSSS